MRSHVDVIRFSSCESLGSFMMMSVAGARSSLASDVVAIRSVVVVRGVSRGGRFSLLGLSRAAHLQPELWCRIRSSSRRDPSFDWIVCVPQTVVVELGRDR